jgi:hypothetical protein
MILFVYDWRKILRLKEFPDYRCFHADDYASEFAAMPEFVICSKPSFHGDFNELGV